MLDNSGRKLTPGGRLDRPGVVSRNGKWLNGNQWQMALGHLFFPPSICPNVFGVNCLIGMF